MLSLLDIAAAQKRLAEKLDRQMSPGGSNPLRLPVCSGQNHPHDAVHQLHFVKVDNQPEPLWPRQWQGGSTHQLS